MNTLPLRLNGFEFAGRPPGTFLVTRVDGRPGADGHWVLYITLRHPPAAAVRSGSYPTAYFPVPAADLIYTLPEDDEAPATSQLVGAVASCPAAV
jgi:hypothetical protein